MAHIKEISFKNGIIRCLYSPEKCGEYGEVEYNTETDECIISKTGYDKGTDMYTSVVLNKLRNMVKERNIPSEYNVVFY